MNDAYPKKPSLYFRRKIRPGEKTLIYFVIEKYVKYDYLTGFSNQTSFIQNSKNFTMTTDSLYKYCLMEGQKSFPMNKNMCDFAKTTYGKY